MRVETDLIMGKEVGTVKKVCETCEYHAFHGLPDTRSERNRAEVWKGEGLTRFGNEGMMEDIHSLGSVPVLPYAFIWERRNSLNQGGSLGRNTRCGPRPEW